MRGRGERRGADASDERREAQCEAASGVHPARVFLTAVHAPARGAFAFWSAMGVKYGRFIRTRAERKRDVTTTVVSLTHTLLARAMGSEARVAHPTLTAGGAWITGRVQTVQVAARSALKQCVLDASIADGAKAAQRDVARAAHCDAARFNRTARPRTRLLVDAHDAGGRCDGGGTVRW